MFRLMLVGVELDAESDTKGRFMMLKTDTAAATALSRRRALAQQYYCQFVTFCTGNRRGINNWFTDGGPTIRQHGTMLQVAQMFSSIIDNSVCSLITKLFFPCVLN